jgi:predicted negative regulator of RcsB-dependent stress response
VKRLALVCVALLAIPALFAWQYHARSSTTPTVDSAESHPNLVLLTIDTLRADRLRRGLTPAIDALAALR